jgi:hypothetical protein
MRWTQGLRGIEIGGKALTSCPWGVEGDDLEGGWRERCNMLVPLLLGGDFFEGGHCGYDKEMGVAKKAIWTWATRTKVISMRLVGYRLI